MRRTENAMSGRDQEFREFIRNRASPLHQSLAIAAMLLDQVEAVGHGRQHGCEQDQVVGDRDCATEAGSIRCPAGESVLR